MQLYGSFPEETRFSKARTVAVWRKSCSLGPFPFPLYLIPAISSAMMNQRLTLHFGILLPRPFTNRKDSLLTIPSNGILFRYDIYWRRTFSRDSFMGTVVDVRFLSYSETCNDNQNPHQCSLLKVLPLYVSLCYIGYEQLPE